MHQTIDKLRSPFIPAWEKHKAPSLDQTSVYLEARREWNERYGDYIAREHAWKLGFFLMGFITLISVSCLAYTSSQSKLVPYVVAVDKLGAAAAVQRADVAARPDTRVIRAQLARWIEDVRSVYQDAGAERMNIESAYAMLHRSDPACVQLNEYMSKHDPFERAKTEGVNVQISTVMPISDNNTWQVQWKETTHSSKGETLKTTEFQANITIAVDAPTNEATLLRNPMGVYITNYHWSERL